MKKIFVLLFVIFSLKSMAGDTLVHPPVNYGIADFYKYSMQASYELYLKNYVITGQTIAQTICTYTTGAADSSFSIMANLRVTAISVDVIQTQITYTDETNTPQTLILYGMGLTSAGLTTTGVSNYSVVGEIRVKVSTTITVATNLTTSVGSITYNAHATIIKIR